MLEFGFKNSAFSELRKKTHTDMYPAIEKRIVENPIPTKEELFVGAFGEMLEPQVRGAIFLLQKKGYASESSGFGGEHGVTQTIDGYFLLDEDTKKNIEALGVTVLVGEEVGLPIDTEVYTSIQFESDNPDIDALAKKWEQIIACIPDAKMEAPPSISGASEDFREKFAKEWIDVERQALCRNLEFNEFDQQTTLEMQKRLNELSE
jgi:hypothetical protein